MFTARTFNLIDKPFLILVASFFAACLAVEGEPDSHLARVTVEMEVNSPETLGKSRAVRLSRILVRMVSDKKDTLYDTITSAGSRISRNPDTFLAPKAFSQVVSARYDLAPNRSWKITTRLMDARDSVRQLDSLHVPKLKAFEYRTVAMCLHPRVTAFNAHFFLPSEIDVRVSGGAVASRRVYFTHLNLMEGSEVKCDTATMGASGPEFLRADAALLPGSEGAVFFKTGSFGETPSILLADEYVKVGIREFTLNAYGYLEGDTVGVTPVRLLFQGVQSVNTALAKEVGSVTMEWQAENVVAGGDADSVAPLVVSLGRVGTLIINVRMSGEIEF